MAVLIDADDLSVSLAERALFRDLSLTVTEKDRLGVVGINGTGKSTLLRVLAGTQVPESGQVRRGRGMRVSMLDQLTNLPSGTVREVVGEGWEAESILDRLGMGDMGERDVSQLSGGQTKRVALAKALLEPAELLILDEPTNHLDIGAVAWLETWLGNFAGGVILVSHDRHLLDRVTNRMLELDRGKSYLHEGGYDVYLQARSTREEQAAEAESVRKNLAARELAWLRRGAKARSRKPQARVEAAKRLIAERPEEAARATPLEMAFGTPRLGSKVVDLESVSVGYEADSPVLHGVSLSLDPKERLGIVGVNGSGKSTLLDVIGGLTSPSSGKIEHGVTVKVGYYTQHEMSFDPEIRVRELVAGSTRVVGDPVDMKLMEQFWFNGELQWAKIKTLSGGERRRLQLLMVLVSRPNLLLLDEPTNDLDLDTLRSLEDFLETWPGAVVTVSHDRTFLDRVTDRLVACEAGTVAPVPGGLEGWLRLHGSQAGSNPSLKPKPSPSTLTEDEPAYRQVTSPSASTPAPAAKRPSGSSGSELRRLDKEMTRLSRQRDKLATDMGSTTDRHELVRIGEELANVQSALEEVENEWLSLAEQA